MTYTQFMTFAFQPCVNAQNYLLTYLLTCLLLIYFEYLLEFSTF